MGSPASVADVATVDFSAFPDDAALAQAIGAEMERTGIMFITNTGFNDQLMDDLWDAAGDFFALPSEVKTQCLYKFPPGPGTGWYIKPGQKKGYDANIETKDRPKQLTEDNETLRNYQFYDNLKRHGEDVAPGLMAKMKHFEDACLELSLRITDCLAIWWKKDPSSMRSKLYSSILEGRPNNNLSGGKVNYYAPLDENTKEGDQRLSLHPDTGLVTLLWPTQPGLQIQQGGKYIEGPHGAIPPPVYKGGEFFNVPLPPPGGLLVFAGTVLQAFTANKMPAPWHRVVVPPGATEPERRISYAYNCHPDNHVLNAPLDGETAGAETVHECSTRMINLVVGKKFNH